MFKNLFDRLKGLPPELPPDPTADWPQLNVTTPTINWSAGTIGGLRFGADMVSARSAFGRPDHFNAIPPDSCDLLYGRAGFQLYFTDDELAYASIFIGSDDHVPDYVTLSSTLLDGYPLTRNTTLEDIIMKFGDPDTLDEDAEETIITYTRHELSVEFEFFPQGCLKRFSACPPEE